MQHRRDTAMAAFLATPGSGGCSATGPASRDPCLFPFPAPGTFDIPSTGAPHLTYGGAAPARAELQESLPGLAAALRSPAPTGPPTGRGAS